MPCKYKSSCYTVLGLFRGWGDLFCILLNSAWRQGGQLAGAPGVGLAVAQHLQARSPGFTVPLYFASFALPSSLKSLSSGAAQWGKPAASRAKALTAHGAAPWPRPETMQPGPSGMSQSFCGEGSNRKNLPLVHKLEILLKGSTRTRLPCESSFQGSSCSN